MFAEYQRRDLSGRDAEPRGEQAAEANRVEYRTQTDDPIRADPQFVGCQLREHVHGIRDHVNYRRVLQARTRKLLQDGTEQLHVALYQIEPALVRLTPQSRGDYHDVRSRDLIVATRDDALVAGERRAM